MAGLPAEKLVEAHGTFFTAHCLNCRKEYDLEFVKGDYLLSRTLAELDRTGVAVECSDAFSQLDRDSGGNERLFRTGAYRSLRPSC